MEGCTRSEIRLFTDPTQEFHLPDLVSDARWLMRPSLPTAVLNRAKLVNRVLVQLEDVVQDVGDLTRQPDLVHRQTRGEIPFLERDQRRQDMVGGQEFLQPEQLA